MALWILLVGSAITVGQRFLAVRRAGRGPAAPPRHERRRPPRRRSSRPARAAARLAARLTDAGFAAGWRRGASCCRSRRPGRRSTVAGRWAAGRDGRGVRQLRANLRVVTGGRLTEPELDGLTRRAVRSYARYWQEAFRLPA